MPRAWEIGYTQPCINYRGKSATHFVYFWSSKTHPYTHQEATSYIPQQGQSLHIWITSLSTTGCYKNNYTIQFLWMAHIIRYATAILSGETELALGTISVKSPLSFQSTPIFFRISPWVSSNALCQMLFRDQQLLHTYLCLFLQPVYSSDCWNHPIASLVPFPFLKPNFFFHPRTQNVDLVPSG